MPRPLDILRCAGRRPLWLRRLAGLACLGALTLYALVGCQGPTFATAGWPDWGSFRSQSPDEDDDADEQDRSVKPGTTLDIPYIGDYVTSFGGTGLIPVQGVGLIVGLDNTGEDPPPSHFRSQLTDEMRRHKIDKPNEVLASPQTAMVLVRAYIPVNVRKGDTFDAEVILPPNTEATSLAGGWLLEARLAEQRVTGGGRILEGHVLATASGPVLVSSSSESTATAANLRRGRVLGGVKSKIDRDLDINLRSEYRMFRNTTRIASAIGRRFHGHDKHGLKIPMAEAKTDQRIVLKVPDQYKENYPRYLSVVRNMAFRESEIAQRVRMQKLEQQLMIPAESEMAALRLEAIGPQAVLSLKRALTHEDIEIRFNAAMALTYMGHADGLAVLAEAARDEPAFRVYALAALACCKDAEASVELRTLLKEAEAESRYGAFRALTILNERDPVVAGVTMNGEYKLHVLDVEGPPLVHLTHHTKAEIVLFGARQELQLPAALRAGPHIQVIASPGSDMVSVSCYSGNQRGKKVVSPRLVDVIGACDELGATYPDIVALMMQAEKQHNLPGKLAIDALPEAGRIYVSKDGSGDKRTIGNEYTAPNIYAPPGSDAAEARAKDVDAVTLKQPGNLKAAEQSDSGIRPAGAEEGEGGVVTADAESPADAASPAGEDADDGEAASGEAASNENEPKWYSPQRFFKKPQWLDGGPPAQWEPGAE